MIKIAILLVLFVPVSVYAQDFQGKTINIKKNEPAPYDGILLDSVAIAKILAEREYAKKQCDLDKNYELNKQQAKCDLENSKLKVDLDVLNKKYDEVNKLKDNEISRLTELVKKSDDSGKYKILYFIGGVVVGIGATVGIAYAVVHAR